MMRRRALCYVLIAGEADKTPATDSKLTQFWSERNSPQCCADSAAFAVTYSLSESSAALRKSFPTVG